MKVFWVGLLTLVVSACSMGSSILSDGEVESAGAQALPPAPPLEDLGPAPELTSEVWLNTDQTLRLRELRGKVVLLEMWTFG